MPHLPSVKINRSSLFATGFFVLSLITAVSITSNPLKTQLLGTFAKGKKSANDYGSPALRRAMGGGNVASSAPVVPDNGYTFSTVVNTAATGPDQTGWDCKNKGGCNSQAGDVSGYYESTPGSGKYYPIGGTGNDPNTYIKDSLAMQSGHGDPNGPTIPGLTSAETAALYNYLNTGIGATSADVTAICNKVSTGCDTKNLSQFAADELKLSPDFKDTANTLLNNYKVRQAQLIGKQTFLATAEPGKTGYYMSCINSTCPGGSQSSVNGSCACFVGSSTPTSTTALPGIVAINTKSQDACSTASNGRYYAYQPGSSECIISTNPLTSITADQFKTLAIQNQVMTADQCAGVKRSSGASASWSQDGGICSIQPIVPEVPTVRQGADCSGSCPSGGQYAGTITGNSCTCIGLNTTIPTQVVPVAPAAPVSPIIPINPDGTFGQKDFPATDLLPNGQPMPKQGCAPVAGANIADSHGHYNVTPDDFADMIPKKYWSEKGLGAEPSSALVQLLTNTGDFEGKSPFHFSYEPYTNATNLNVNSTGTVGLWNRMDNNDVVLIGVDAAKGTAGSGPNGQGIAHVTYLEKAAGFNNYTLERNDYFGTGMGCQGDTDGQGFSCSNNKGDTLHLPTNNQAVGILHPPPGN